MDWLFSTELWVALLTLAALEIVLGIDNLVFISIAVSRLPPDRRPSARRFGLALACLTRIMLLLSLAFLASMENNLFSLFGQDFSVRDLVLIAGGLFLLVKGTMEIHDSVEGRGEEEDIGTRPSAVFGVVIAQIAVIDIVFSLDSVITAVGMVDNRAIMVAAILVAVAVMLFAANPIGDFIDRHPTVKMLALSFIILVGVALVADGFDFHIDRKFLYFAMAFSAGVESLNILAARKRRRT
ncbi:TerC family protein [Arenimonas fontis]|uniref:TerC family protein n=1 Tax=Arenimonas fontis TaxID=2608255 RepID=A0A5B2Z423_9GAMM|nr:TerC family protein [Arenimonas fontis]KAA2283688.1 TerC family protein [Arenimonas fontis]